MKKIWRRWVKKKIHPPSPFKKNNNRRKFRFDLLQDLETNAVADLELSMQFMESCWLVDMDILAVAAAAATAVVVLFRYSPPISICQMYQYNVGNWGKCVWRLYNSQRKMAAIGSPTMRTAQTIYISYNWWQSVESIFILKPLS